MNILRALRSKTSRTAIPTFRIVEELKRQLLHTIADLELMIKKERQRLNVRLRHLTSAFR